MYGFVDEGIINISNVFDGNEIQASYEGEPIILKLEQLMEFISEYINTAEYVTSKIDEDGSTRIARHDGINIVLYDELKQILVTQGLDIDESIHPTYEIKAETLMQKIKEAREDEFRNGFEISIRNESL